MLKQEGVTTTTSNCFSQPVNKVGWLITSTTGWGRVGHTHTIQEGGAHFSFCVLPSPNMRLIM